MAHKFNKYLLNKYKTKFEEEMKGKHSKMTHQHCFLLMELQWGYFGFLFPLSSVPRIYYLTNDDDDDDEEEDEDEDDQNT